MIGFVIWIVGLLLALKAALEIWKKAGDSVKKILLIVVLVLTSWVGLLVYYFYARPRIAGWVR